MEKCAAYRIAEPAARKGNWRDLMPGAKVLWVEVGCGKGKFTAETAAANPEVLLIAMSGTDHCHDHTQNHTDDQRHRRHIQRRAHALQININ